MLHGGARGEQSPHGTGGMVAADPLPLHCLSLAATRCLPAVTNFALLVFVTPRIHVVTFPREPEDASQTLLGAAGHARGAAGTQTSLWPGWVHGVGWACRTQSC